MIDHSTEPFPEPVAPATRMCCPNTGSRHHAPVSVAPTPTLAESTLRFGSWGGAAGSAWPAHPHGAR